jgi:CDP-2,3-bis-(O-geranylgeranyl)-sn-glycerol synthase
MMDPTLAALLIFIPAGLANAAPVLANKIPGLNSWKTPMDLGKSLRGKRVFGDNKTWRGLFFGTLVGCLTGMVLHLLAPEIISSLEIVPLVPFVDMLLIGGLLGFGALYGDAAESFFKRQLGVQPGHSWFPFDQIDYIIGGLLAVAPLGLFNWSQMAIIFVVYFVLHLVIAYLAYLLKLKDQPI